MRTVEADIVSHVTQGALWSALLDGLQALGKRSETVTLDDLAAVDEFRNGGCFAPVELVARRA